MVYENGSATEITAGITVTSPFDSVVGLHKVEIAATGANGFESAKEYMAYLNPDEKVNGQDANAVIVYFSIENRYQGNNISVADILTTAMTEAYSAKGGTLTIAQALYETVQHLQERAISGTTDTVKKRDQSTTALTLTLDDGNSPTSTTRAT